jgi:SAM-dependent methyltransferase
LKNVLITINLMGEEMKQNIGKKLERYGVAGIDFDSVDKAKAFTYDTKERNFPSTELIFKENPFTQDILTAKNILEIGCGVGRNLPWIMENTKAKYFGVDPNPSMLQYFWEVNPNPEYRSRAKIHTDFSKLKTVQFDVVLCTYVFQHISYRPQPPEMDIDDITQEIFTMTHPGTVFIFIEHDKEEPGWIERWIESNKILPDVFIRDWTVSGRCSQEHQCDRGTHHLIIFKR